MKANVNNTAASLGEGYLSLNPLCEHSNFFFQLQKAKKGG